MTSYGSKEIDKGVGTWSVCLVYLLVDLIHLKDILVGDPRLSQEDIELRRPYVVVRK